MPDDVLQDAMMTVACAAGAIQAAPKADEHSLFVAEMLPKLHRSFGQVISLLNHNLPMSDAPGQDIAYQLQRAHVGDERVALGVICNGLLIALKLYQHPEIRVSLLTHEEANAPKDQG